MPSVFIRLPSEALHEALKDLAHEKRTSLQALCVELFTDAVNKYPKSRAVLHHKESRRGETY